jgi:hypothetical protein
MSSLSFLLTLSSPFSPQSSKPWRHGIMRAHCGITFTAHGTGTPRSDWSSDHVVRGRCHPLAQSALHERTVTSCSQLRDQDRRIFGNFDTGIVAICRSARLLARRGTATCKTEALKDYPAAGPSAFATRLVAVALQWRHRLPSESLSECIGTYSVERLQFTFLILSPRFSIYFWPA